MDFGDLPAVPTFLEGDSFFDLNYLPTPSHVSTAFIDDVGDDDDDDDDNDVDGRLYIVPYRWWKYAKHEDEKMVGILYSAVLKDDSEMQIHLDLKREYNPCVEDEEEGFLYQELAFVKEAMWLRALKWYHDCTALESAVNPVFLKDNTSDVFPLLIRFSASATKSLAVNIRVMDNHYDNYEHAFNIFAAQTKPLHIWDFSRHLKLLVDNANTFSDREEVFLEFEVHGLSSSSMEGTQRDTGMIANDSTERNFCSSSPKVNGSNKDVHSVSAKTVYTDSWKSYVMTSYIGQKGLYNIGNTCFMNSAIQCLVHTPKLVDYFLGSFQKEINYRNPLGMKGVLAVAFGDLLRMIWSPRRTVISPLRFKSKLSNFAPQFNGCNQHDSQEFLVFLLDGLHEDLNRVQKKSENHLDQEVTNEKWKKCVTRADSIIVDLFQGQFRSKLICSVCKNMSVTFDTFMNLTIPLPSTTTRSMTITVVGANELPSSITVFVPKEGTVKDLIQALSDECSVGSDETLLVAKVNHHWIYQYLDNPSIMLDLINDNDQIVAYRLPKESETSLNVEFTHRRAVRRGLFMSRSTGFGIPLVGRFSCLSYGSDLRTAFLNLVNPFLSQNEFKPKENGHSQSHQDPPDVASVSRVDLDPEPDTEDDSSSSNTFQFSDSDSAFSAVKMDEPLTKSRKRKKIVVTWPESMVEKYDKYLSNSLPAICHQQIKPEESLHLHKCLEAFMMEEHLGPDNLWYCPSCKKNQQALKKLDLWRLPEILVIHLKRFSFDGICKRKLNAFVDFPLDDLDLSSYIAQSESPCDSSCHYTLYSIINHYGDMGGGHYTAYVQHGHDNWYKFDDDEVVRIDRDAVKTSAAYILFYKRVC